MCHTSLVTKESCQMAWLVTVVLGKSFHLTTVTLTPLLGQKTQRTMSRGGELPVWLKNKMAQLNMCFVFEGQNDAVQTNDVIRDPSILITEPLVITRIFPSSGQLYGNVQVCEYEMCWIVASLYKRLCCPRPHINKQQYPVMCVARGPRKPTTIPSNVCCPRPT
jgi:hypothetical protein